jgi:UDPglucose 6-dehydrogenase
MRRYLGLTHAACMADLGHDVLAIDTDHERLAQVSAGEMPKDIRAFRATAASLGADSMVSLLGAVDEINKSRRSRMVDMARDAVGGSLAGKRVAALGLAFKPNSDDRMDRVPVHRAVRAR